MKFDPHTDKNEAAAHSHKARLMFTHSLFLLLPLCVSPTHAHVLARMNLLQKFRHNSYCSGCHLSTESHTPHIFR